MVGYGIEASDLDISFGRFRLLPARRLLLEGDKPVRIGSRALDLLIALAERPCELISKAELIAKVWPDTFVGETNLRVHIRSLRRTLGDGQAGNRYISNATGRGYSFVAPVSASARPRGPTVPQAVTEPLSTVTLPLRSSIGRDELIGKVLAQLPDQGLSTFVGPGGIGKTSVSVAITERLSEDRKNSVCCIDLAAASGPRLSPATLAAAPGLEHPAGDPSASLFFFFRNMRMLLVLDNCIIEALNLACKFAGARQRRKQDAFKKLKRHVANVA